MIRPTRLLLAALTALAAPWTGFAAAPGEPAELVAAGVASQEHGDLPAAFKQWDRAAELYAKKRDAAGEFDVLLRQIAACQALGQQKIALAKLSRADDLAGDDPHRQAQVKGARGAVSMFARQAGNAEKLLTESARLAGTTHDDDLAAADQHNLGLLHTGQGDFAKARTALETAQRLAAAAGDRLLGARIHQARAEAETAAGDFTAAREQAAATVDAASALPDSRDKAYLLMGAGRAFERIFKDAPAHDNALRLRAFHLYEQGAAIAANLGDAVAQSYALGYQGAMYEFEKRDGDALALTRRALALAQQARAPDSIYRWEWQVARVLARQGDRDAAIEGYRRAVTTLQGIRNDIAIRYGNTNAGSSFREVVGGVYFELADLLLQRASATADDGEKQKLLREARSTAELLKAAELEDYFQDDCVSLRRELTKNVENIDPRAAVIYYIPLADRTEILVSLPVTQANQPARLARFKAAPNDDLLYETARQFRVNLEDRTSYAYLQQAHQLYDWLIQPVEPLLRERKFTTLVFVPDGALRTIPMSALHDGAHFLVEKYAVAVTPGLELMEVKKSSEVLSRMLVSGLSESVQGFAALPSVPAELDRISKLYGGSSTLRDKNFSTEKVSDQLKSEQYSIVHMATHGVFTNDVRKSFVLTHDNQLTLDDLERLIRPGQLADKPLELLTLSACETAAGDDRAALGLAGVAVKAGARSAFASLWSVNDRASSVLVADFYEQLKKPKVNKAQALQIAQKKLLADPRFAHPCYWAPYLMIGNWL